ncbi:transketolase [Anaerococcus sp. NML200537]|uniref:transketolase n=1 Tax=Anaerococcus sp. NML200537 TaxID=2954485 RepID=UPI002237C34D|nr:transketolase [Anaerococcus sp. NML200537]MCW6700706.1 transketolase [Anaerococcus sp. NML200537]
MTGNKDIKAIAAIRSLSLAQIEKANSGHPGICMGAAPMIYSLWNKYLNVNPKNPSFFNRDRFVLSAGHGSALLYSMIHLAGYNLPIEDLKNFRQIGSKAPGHPERLDTEGVEVTTGPLGQGIANAVGMALAEKHMAAVYNKEDYPVIDHKTYCLCGDGDLMEGVSYEAMSLAGHLKLSKLVMLYDSNDICLDGKLNTSFSENVEERVKAQGWNYIKVDDGEDLEAIGKAIEKANSQDEKPSLIEIKTIIGYGSANQGTNKVHGAPLGGDDFAKAKEFYKWENKDFEIPEKIYDTFKENLGKRGQEANKAWDDLMEEYKKAYPEAYQSLINGIERKLDDNFFDKIRKYTAEDKALASRASGGEILQDLAKNNRNIWGGSADLFSSNKTDIGESPSFKDDPSGRNVWYGVREFAMATIGNGIMAHGGSFHHVSTFFVFVDYVKAALRLSALSKLPLTYVFTHDSVAVGEDGPTHEPIEQLAMVRSIPNVIDLRPADGNEVRQAWKIALESKESPTVIALSRQNLENLKATEKLESIEKGAYIIKEASKEKPDGIFIATGSEVALAIKAAEALEKEGQAIRVISMPSMTLFRKQDASYKESLLPKDVKNRVSIEMASSFGWAEWTGDKGLNIAIDDFGISGPGDLVAEKLGFSVDNIVKKYKEKYL